MDIGRRLAELERRLKAVERSSRLEQSSVHLEDGSVLSVPDALAQGVQASSVAADALAQAADAASIADGKLSVFYDATADTIPAPAAGDLWLPNGTLPMFRWDEESGLWLDASDSELAAALVAVQDTVDRKVETFWSVDAPALASEGDLWFNTAQGNLPSRWTNGAWVQLPLGNGALLMGDINPDRLTVGVVANLVQDPQAKTALRTPPAEWWSIQGPDTVYPESNYFRSAGHANGSLPVVPGLGGVSDSTWILTNRIAVDPGRTVRVGAFVRADAAACVSPQLARLRVRFTKDDGITSPPLTQDYIAELALSTDVVPGEWTPLERSITVPEGYSGVEACLQSTYQTAGNIDFIKPEVQVLWSRVQSVNYIEGKRAWALDDETTQFEDVNVLGELGADTVSARAVTIGGLDLETEYLTPLPLGGVAFDSNASGSHAGNTSGTDELRLFEYAFGPSVTGRLYKATIHGHFQGAANDAYDFRVRYTMDGSIPSYTSLLHPGSLQRFNLGPGSTHFLIVFFFALNSADRVRQMLTVQRAIGTGAGFAYLTDPSRRLEWAIEDLGLYTNAALAGTLSQKKTGGGTVAEPSPPPPAPDPPTTYTKTFYATWTRSYDSDNGTRQGDDGPDLYQGYISGTHGNTRSLAGFDYAAIQSFLSGATVKSCKLTYRVAHAWGGAGITVGIGTHNYTSKPGSWSGSSVTERRISKSGQKEGSTYTHELGTGIGNEFKSGSTRGVSFGPAPSNSASAYYGWMYGGTSSGSRPKLTIVCTK